MAGRKTDRSVEIQTNNICMDGKHYRQMRKCAVNWPSKHVARVEATFGEMKPVFLLICISFKPPLQLKSYGNPPVFCQRLFALQLPSFSQKFRRKRLSFPGSLNKSILLFWLSTKRERETKKIKKSTSNICYTCPSSLNCGIHEFLNRLCFPLSRKKHERANSSAKHQLQHQLFWALRLCQDWETYDGIAIVINIV